MNVILNRWQGGALAYPRCTCWSCGQPASVVEFPHYPDGGLLARICGTCLCEARDSLGAALLPRLGEWEPEMGTHSPEAPRRLSAPHRSRLRRAWDWITGC